jgi:Fe2+ or Zn2+ uptake regulation protein
MNTSTCNALLRNAGLRVTKLHSAILKLLARSKTPYTIPSFLIDLEKEHSLTPNKTSLYRNMEHLVAAGLIEEVAAPSRATAYKKALLEHHHHLICRDCQKVVDIDVPHLEVALHTVEKDLGTREGFGNVSHDVTFLGTCLDCVNEKSLAA